MDPTDPGQGQDKPPEQDGDLTPSSRGRQRKKNPKYFDYETDEVADVQWSKGRTPRSSPRGRGRGGGRGRGRGGAASKRTPAKNRSTWDDAEETEEEDAEAPNKTTQESDEKSSEETPKKAVRAKKTPRKRTPARTAPAVKTPSADGGKGAVDGVQQENGTPKPKTASVRKQPKQEVDSATETPCKEAAGGPPTEPEEETTPGGRRRRGAAKAALKYLHILAKEVLGHHSDEAGAQPGANSDHTEQRGCKGGKGQKRKRPVYDSDPPEDEDFVPNTEDEEVEQMEDEDEDEEAEASDSDVGRSPASFHIRRTYTGSKQRTENGLLSSVMRTVWDAAETTKKFREEHYSSWVFPEWVPSTKDWHPVPQSDLEKYLPQEHQSAAFRVSRDGIRNTDGPLQRLGRLAAVPAHPERWDMVLFAGGPLWAMEWCPTPDGAPASQFIALACHRGMDDQHLVNQTYGGPGLVQLWDVGRLECDSRPDAQPALAYGLAQDRGFIWSLKWCPAGGWEPPSCDRKAPFLPRLGLLAVATSTGVVTIYSLPHPDALHSNKQPPNSGKDGQQLPLYQAKGVLTLKLGSFKAPHHDKSGQGLSMDWLPVKPHNIMAIGFYDGVVGLWNLSSRSALLRVREPDGPLSLLPYRCLLAHDHAVRALCFCPASRHLLVTAGEDRYVKTWDLRRLYDPITVQKRNLTNEIVWPLNAPGYMVAQENAYAAAGSHGVHYFDHHMRTYFAIPRTGTVWSLTFSDWMNSLMTSDSLGEVIFAVLPQISICPQYIKRTIERRFPVYCSSLVPYDAKEEEHQETGGAEEQGGEETDGGSEAGNGNDTESGGGGGGGGRKDDGLPLRFPTYREAVKKYYLQHTDNDMRNFKGNEKRAIWKRMKDTEGKAKINMDEMPLVALHKVRFNPNMCSHVWMVSGGQTGLVRLHCLRGLISPTTKTMISKNQAQFTALYSPKDQSEAVHTETDVL